MSNTETTSDENRNDIVEDDNIRRVPVLSIYDSISLKFVLRNVGNSPKTNEDSS